MLLAQGSLSAILLDHNATEDDDDNGRLEDVGMRGSKTVKKWCRSHADE